ncbi:MAG: flagellar hook-length control protein FliK, partial [Sulfuricurvum sp.]
FNAKNVAATTNTTETNPMEAALQLLERHKAGLGKETEKNSAASATGKTDSSSSVNTAQTTSKTAAESDPLKQLLQNIGKKETASDTPVTTSAAPKAQETPASQKTDSLLSLLQGTSLSEKQESNSSEGTGESKITTVTDKTLQVLKADSFEVKTKEAQQSMKLFAVDLKEAVESYKPPFTRLTMKLNPEKLGDVEVTLIQRGNNVHVNIQSSNTTGLAFLAQNATELKSQLAHQGITNATMNFMSNGDTPSQQQQQQHNPNRFQAYKSFEELESSDEQLAALELIIPYYA